MPDRAAGTAMFMKRASARAAASFKSAPSVCSKSRRLDRVNGQDWLLVVPRF
jgi:hypothetical protein